MSSAKDDAASSTFDHGVAAHKRNNHLSPLPMTPAPAAQGPPAEIGIDKKNIFNSLKIKK